MDCKEPISRLRTIAIDACSKWLKGEPEWAQVSAENATT